MNVVFNFMGGRFIYHIQGDSLGENLRKVVGEWLSLEIWPISKLCQDVTLGMNIYCAGKWGGTLVDVGPQLI